MLGQVGATAARGSSIRTGRRVFRLSPGGIFVLLVYMRFCGCSLSLNNKSSSNLAMDVHVDYVTFFIAMANYSQSGGLPGNAANLTRTAGKINTTIELCIMDQ